MEMEERPKRRARKGPGRVIRAFLFSDIVGSTEILNRFIRRWGQHQGNEQFREAILRPHDERLEKCIEAHEGEVVSTAGDSYFVTFKDARRAIECAVAFQRSLLADPIPIPLAGGDLPKHLQVRIGLHAGAATAVSRAGQPNYQDETINIAHRIQEHAEGEQILTSKETWLKQGKSRVSERVNGLGTASRG
jgi:class 3 adenylate cyclase